MENMSEIKGYSCPNIKVQIDTVDYTVEDGRVECRMTIKPHKANQYSQLVAIAANVLDMRPAIHNQYEWLSDKFGDADFENEMKRTSATSYIYLPECQAYKGVATLKDGDISDVELAKTIAYKKAYRQMTGFYAWCYKNLYERVLMYAHDVFFGQYSQLIERVNEADNEVFDNTRK